LKKYLKLNPKKNNIRFYMKVIGISGYARCGKDTFVKIASDILRKNHYIPMRFAFADRLKDEVEKMLKRYRFQAKVKTEKAEQKALIRPLLVWWGCQRRHESDKGLYWVNLVDQKIRDLIKEHHNDGVSSERMVALISDVRFQNEAEWIQKEWNGSVIHLKKWSPKWRVRGKKFIDNLMVKIYDVAPNEEERKQDPLVQEISNVKTEWEEKGHETLEMATADKDLQKVVLNALNNTKLFNEQIV